MWRTGLDGRTSENDDPSSGRGRAGRNRKMVGMDALSPSDRLKMEAARSIREDFLHQNSFHDVDTYTSLKKQYMMMKLVNAFYERGRCSP